MNGRSERMRDLRFNPLNNREKVNEQLPPKKKHSVSNFLVILSSSSFIKTSNFNSNDPLSN